MSPTRLVLCSALSTAFKPFTPTAPSEDESMVSQPGPSGSQLTVGGVTPTAACAWPGRRGRLGNGKACWLGDEAAAESEARGSTLSVKKGPVSKAQPNESQPVAAGPAKVGANSPKLDDETTG